MSMHVSAMSHIGTSEVKLWDLVLFLHHVVQGIKLGSLGWVARAFANLNYLASPS